MVFVLEMMHRMPWKMLLVLIELVLGNMPLCGKILTWNWIR